MEHSVRLSHPEQTQHLLETRQVFSQSLLWQMQQRYFAESGIDAWRQSEVPHYITSNPTVANSYAEILIAFFRDQQRLGRSDEPLVICELGAGSGRFAFHFLKHLSRLCEQSRLPLNSFRYVLTDVAESNLDFWRQHAHFQPFFASGLLDIARFEINQSEQLALQLAPRTITVHSLQRPIVVIANYVFDSIPQDLFYLNEPQTHKCLVSLSVDENPVTLTPAELLARVQCQYDYQALSEIPFPETYLERLLANYQRSLTNTHLLFPTAGLRCLQRLKALSRDGLMLLSADKGGHDLATLQDRPAPTLIRHGSFSLNVNYHAFKTLCEEAGGIALFPGRDCDHLNISCLMMQSQPGSHIETQRAYQRHVQESGPDDFYTIIKQARQHLAQASLSDILAYLRFSHYDSHQFGTYFLPRLMELAADFTGDERRAMTQAIDRVWDSYFPLGEDFDLAYNIACLFYEMDDYTLARLYFERSIEIYGQYTGTIFNMAACYQQAGQFGSAESLLRRVLRCDPDNRPASELLAQCELHKTQSTTMRRQE